MTEGGKFKPKSLPRESVEAPMQPHWRVMGSEEEKRLHAQAVEEHRRFSPSSRRNRRRFLRYVVVSAIGFGVGGWAVAQDNLKSFLVFAGVGSLVGALFSWWRPIDFLAGLIYAAFGLLGGLLVGAHLLIAVLASLWFGIIGIAVGRQVEMRRMDGED